MSVMGFHATRALKTVAGIRSRSDLARNDVASFIGVAVALLLVLFSGPWKSFGAESSPPSLATSRLEETNSPDLLQVSLRLQEQLHATLLAIDRNGLEAKEAAVQNTAVLSQGLGSIERALSVQHARDLEAMQRSKRVMLIVVGVFATMSFLTCSL
jgi:hypothetical protein